MQKFKSKDCQTDTVEDRNKILVCYSSTSNQDHKLPIINVRFGNNKFLALLDTGANLSLIQPSVIAKLKESQKIDYVSRSVKIKTLDQSTIPYSSAVNLKFKISTKWFNNLFFVTQQGWNSKYSIILGYDFLQRNKIILNAASKELIVDNVYIKFDESEPVIVCKENSNEVNEFPNDNSIMEGCNYKKDDTVCHVNRINSNIKYKKKMDKQNNSIMYANSVFNVTVPTNSFEIVTLSISKTLKNCNILFSPTKSKCKLFVDYSLHNPNLNFIFVIVHNNTDAIITIRKETKLGIVEKFNLNEIIPPEEEEALQVNNLNIQEVHKLRLEELNASDFDLDHLNANDKQSILNLLLKNYKNFSKSYKTLGCTDEVIPEFNLLHNFPIQTKPYPLPKIAKKFAGEEIKQLLDAGIIEPSYSNYSFPVIFVKKKSVPNSELKFRMVVDYRLLNCITEPFKICLPKITNIMHNIAGRKFYCVLDLKSAFFQI